MDQMAEQGYPDGVRWVVALQLADDAADDAADADADTADADAAADDDADADTASKRIFNLLTEEQPMREGLLMVTLPGRFGYSVTLVGHVRHVRGFEYEMGPGHVSVVRTSGRRTLGELASDGPGDDHRCTTSASAEDLHEFRVRRVKPCDAKAWAEVVKRPKGWE